MTKEDARVRLNVGGTIYETYVATLRRDPDSLLGTMFADRNSVMLKPDHNESEAAPAEQREYFFDRNGRTFEVVLDYCRTGKLIVPPGMSLESVREELDFWQIGWPVSPTSSRTSPLPSIDDPEDPLDITTIQLTPTESSFCDFLCTFTLSPSPTPQPYTQMFQRRRHHLLTRPAPPPLTHLLASALRTQSGLLPSDIPQPPRPTSILSLPDFPPSPIFSTRLPPRLQILLERTLAILRDARAASLRTISIAIDLDGEVSGVPSALDRVAAQKRFWKDLAGLVFACAGVAPADEAAVVLGDGRRVAGVDDAGGGSATAVAGAWEAACALWEFREALAMRVAAEGAREGVKEILGVEAVRRKFAGWGEGKDGKLQVEYLSHWNVTMNVP
ncbi:hypothetical protein BJ742DRAFT_845298 [Cladochytrium replicatum]|nr:hypothetical protein BJ742DRAFT_845298 [Cladochytrium replicatum]